jgi:O-antigen biosynthesis alpha-1,2-rhamnosyltransferase
MVMPRDPDWVWDTDMTDGDLRPRLFLDCTATYFHDAHTGIQRVVRNIVRAGRDEGRRRRVEVVPCFFEAGQFFAAPTTEHGELISRVNADAEVDAWSRTRGRYWKILGLVAAAIPNVKLRRWLLASAARPGLARLVRTALRATRTLPGPPVGNGQQPIAIRPSDVLLTLDLACEVGLDVALGALKREGVLLATVFYDLIPIRYPAGIPQSSIDSYCAWVDTVVRPADLVVGISDTVIADLRKYLAESSQQHLNPRQVFASFRLGHELDRRDRDREVRPELRQIFAGVDGARVLLSVGWIDLRKNHLHVLEALRLLQAKGVTPRWVIVGKRGPATDSVLARISDARELASQIFIFHDLSDTELEYCYKSASALVYPSIVEGFGLPMAEALSHGLPVFASDIPVFREFATDFTVFFGLDSPAMLADLLERFYRDGEYPARRPLGEFLWPNWKESVTQLFALVLEHRLPSRGH